MRPTVGRIVHYKHQPSDEPSAAIITRVHDDTWVSLLIISPGGDTRFASHCELGVRWFWPPLVAEPDAGLDKLYAGWAGV
jgi:hypothetical protein